MKKFFFILLVATLILSLSACKTNKANNISSAETNLQNTTLSDSGIKKNPYFNAEVIEISEQGVLVKPDSAAQSLFLADKVYVSLNTISPKGVPSLNVGDNIRVVYNGKVTKSIPPQINGVFKIYLIEKLDK